MVVLTHQHQEDSPDRHLHQEDIWMDQPLARDTVRHRAVRLLQVGTATQRHQALGVQRHQEATDQDTIRHRLRFVDLRAQQVGRIGGLRIQRVLPGPRSQLRADGRLRRIRHGIRRQQRAIQLGVEIHPLVMHLGIPLAINRAWTLSLGRSTI